ncbi:hypothetical protein [Stieleria marina]|uniref:Uncharacterized protein n=1 Tax=Stieleria marina TaxID=1930275 RepID=A0A517NZD3_9BACT|nr:hypothetical protein K239x_44990 [Planctomycetes bacterium K23_9]
MIPVLFVGGMFAGGLLLSATLFGFAAWLHFNEQNGWAYENGDPEDVGFSQQDRDEMKSPEADAKYLASRKRSRNRVHFLFAASGVLVLIATVAGPGLVFVAAWSCVAFVLMAIMAIATLDGIRTHVHRRSKRSRTSRDLLEADLRDRSLRDGNLRRGDD